jgi:hypothetical protein
MQALDLSTQRFGRLIVLHRDTSPTSRTKWWCQCDCGKPPVSVTTDKLRSGRTSSCGCYHSERSAENVRSLSLTHGMTHTRVYRAWIQMKERCYTTKETKKLANYVDRGIKVCDRWLESFENFYADMGDPPSDNHSLDRRDNDSDYSPENCRWATRKEQMNNRRVNHFITHGDRKQTLTQWSTETGIPSATIAGRLRRGWSVQQALVR